MNSPIGILGGTFNPIHLGHLRMAQEIGEGLDLAEVRLIPAGCPPHREKPGVSPQQRLEMARLAVQKNPLLRIDDREIFKTTPCYTVETLREIRREMGDDQPICLLMGSDAFWGLPTWYRWQELFDLAHIIIAQRPGFSREDLATGHAGQIHEELEKRQRYDCTALHQEPAGAIVTYPITALDISSTRIRALLRQGLNPRYLLPAAVLDYIQANNLYC